ncbi:type II secretion system protein N [Rhodoferax sp. PAMC 29310]|uniref:type II secretion system protein N n=1 Tax=Rhodoferax sp. PAMC 29310 TaxID=2822760 RepID=UPI001B31ABFE|nr:type II secretion system protein N [Rhodoferax sp. PAMC 29310]
MQTHTHGLWWLRLATFSIAALAAASAGYWTLKWSSTSPSGPTTELQQPASAQADPLVVARLLGSSQVVAGPGAPASAAAGQLKLWGVVAGSSKERGYALIGMDDQTPKPYAVGEPINDSLILQSVAPRSASLATARGGPVTQLLELPPLNPP